MDPLPKFSDCFFGPVAFLSLSTKNKDKTRVSEFYIIVN